MKKKVMQYFAVLAGLCLVLLGFLMVNSKQELKLDLRLSDTVYDSDEPIEFDAVLTYAGQEDSFTFYSGEPVVMFAIEGGEFFRGEIDLINLGMKKFTIPKNNPKVYPYRKTVGWHLNSDQDAVQFWKEFMETDELFLPPGTYIIWAQCAYMTEPGGECTIITTRNRITVK